METDTLQSKSHNTDTVLTQVCIHMCSEPSFVKNILLPYFNLFYFTLLIQDTIQRWKSLRSFMTSSFQAISFHCFTIKKSFTTHSFN